MEIISYLKREFFEEDIRLDENWPTISEIYYQLVRDECEHFTRCKFLNESDRELNFDMK